MIPAGFVAGSDGSPAAGGEDHRTHPLHAVRAGLEAAAERLRRSDVAVPPLDGKLLRPVVAYALVPPHRRRLLDETFWDGALAIQMVHEASLLHDDILDDAAYRRGRDTMVAARGVAPALVLGDQYLTGAYRAAARVGSPGFLRVFIEGVERTVAGEVAQNRASGRVLEENRYEEIVTGKSGELFGAAACLADPDAPETRAYRVALGRRLGALYQRVDDLLDYCAAADTGKPPLQDYRQAKWTWILALAGVDSFDRPDEEVLAAVFEPAPDGSASAARRALDRIRRTRDDLMAVADRVAPGDELLGSVLDAWVRAAAEGVAAQERNGPARGTLLPDEGRRPERSAEGEPVLSPRRAAADVVVDQARALGGPERWGDHFATHAKTFRFAARLFPKDAGARVAALYAFCRFSDDLVDAPHDGAAPDVVRERLEAWRTLARRAWEGESVGVPLLDHVFGDARRSAVSWTYPSAVLDGVGMDLSPVRFRDWDHLGTYTFGVAGAVGGWMTQLFGLRDPELLERAHALGDAMQLTNILRDVGEDWGMGRCYLPDALLAAHGLDRDALAALCEGRRPVDGAWVTAMEGLMVRAEAHYERAWPGIRALPSGVRGPVAVAASAYRGIHREVRRAGYDNLTRRAFTSLPRKSWLGAVGLVRARGR